jgi:DNA-directed RNA polymerase specialized sigma subunit
VPAEQQQELRHQQDYHERLGAAALRALQTLSEKNRQVLALYYLSGYSLKELGAVCCETRLAAPPEMMNL